MWNLNLSKSWWVFIKCPLKRLLSYQFTRSSSAEVTSILLSDPNSAIFSFSLGLLAVIDIDSLGLRTLMP